jgi:hypothetical protein
VAIEFHYLDSTVLTRDHLGTSAPLAREGVIISADIVRIELAVVIDRRRLAGIVDLTQANLLRRQLPAVLAPLHLFPLAEEMAQRAAAPFNVAVTALDAIHVATAEVVARDADGTLLFWTLDPRRASAAASRGLAVRGPRGDA